MWFLPSIGWCQLRCLPYDETNVSLSLHLVHSMLSSLCLVSWPDEAAAAQLAICQISMSSVMANFSASPEWHHASQDTLDTHQHRNSPWRFTLWRGCFWLSHLAFCQVTACLCMVHFFAQHT